MTRSSITSSLEKLFQTHRIVFWYDENGELRDEYDACEINDVRKSNIDSKTFQPRITKLSRFLAALLVDVQSRYHTRAHISDCALRDTLE